MKVLLFVDHGRGPKSCGNAYKNVRGEWWFSGVQSDRMRTALAWHVVECENAEAGRLLIAQLSIGEGCRTVPGRILASGGKR